MIEGTEVQIGGERRWDKKNQTYQQRVQSGILDTSNILFVGAGAFQGLDKIIAARLGGEYQRVGFGAIFEKASKSDLVAHVTPDDLIKFGFIPELVGRFPSFANTTPLSATEIRHILTEPIDSIVKQKIAMFALSGQTLVFEDDALALIAEQASKGTTGARALRSLVEQIVLDMEFEAPTSGQTEFTVTSELVRKKLNIPEQTSAPEDDYSAA